MYIYIYIYIYIYSSLLDSLILINMVPGNKRGGVKFGPFLINELWVENSQKINCRDVTSILEGRVYVYMYNV